jgi:hypothetical protein
MHQASRGRTGSAIVRLRDMWLGDWYRLHNSRHAACGQHVESPGTGVWSRGDMQGVHR